MTPLTIDQLDQLIAAYYQHHLCLCQYLNNGRKQPFDGQYDWSQDQLRTITQDDPQQILV